MRMVEGRVIPQAQSASSILVTRSTTKALVNDSGLLLAVQRHRLGASLARDSR